jgi:mRNA interferase MazF
MKSLRRGEVWLIALNPTAGAELNKARPAVIISRDNVGVVPLKVIVPLTAWKERYSAAFWLVGVD